MTKRMRGDMRKASLESFLQNARIDICGSSVVLHNIKCPFACHGLFPLSRYIRPKILFDHSVMAAPHCCSNTSKRLRCLSLLHSQLNSPSRYQNRRKAVRIHDASTLPTYSLCLFYHITRYVPQYYFGFESNKLWQIRPYASPLLSQTRHMLLCSSRLERNVAARRSRLFLHLLLASFGTAPAGQARIRAFFHNVFNSSSVSTE